MKIYLILDTFIQSFTFQKMSTFGLREILENTEGLTNMTIVCGDGVIRTHKIVVASVSDFIKKLIISIPAEDPISILLPDYDMSCVQDFLTLDPTSPTTKRDIFMVNDLSPALTKTVKSEEVKREPDYPLDYADGDELDNSLVELEESFYNYSGINCRRKRRKGKRDLDVQPLAIAWLHVHNLDCSADENIIIDNPTSSKEERHNYLATTRLLYRDAIISLAQGESVSFCEAARKFKVNHSTLARMLRDKKPYEGFSKKSKLFFKDEELEMKRMIIEKFESGQIINTKVIKEIIIEKINWIMFNQPERYLPEKMDSTIKNFVRHFVDRHRLNKYYGKSKC